MRIPVSGVLICCLFGLGCSKVEDLQPQSDFEKSTDSLPAIKFDLDSTGSKVVQFDSIAQGGNFSISLTGFKHCKLKIQNQGKTILVEAQGKNWKKDSSNYTICKNNHCRDGVIFLTNKQYYKDSVIIKPVDSCVILPFRHQHSENFGDQAFISDFLLPPGVNATINTVSVLNFYGYKYSDNLIYYEAKKVGATQKWGFDTISYTLNGSDGKCYKGKIGILIGDTCEASARDDNFIVTNGYREFLEDEFAANDKDCNGNISLAFTTRSTPAFATATVQNTASGFGSLDEGTVNQTSIKRLFKYTRTNPSATKDIFPYYFKNLNSGRVTKAWVYLQLN